MLQTTNVPANAVQGGYQGHEPLYVARGINPANEPTPGKLHPPWGFFLSWGGQEHHRADFEVLVCDSAITAQAAPKGMDTKKLSLDAPSEPGKEHAAKDVPSEDASDDIPCV